MSETAADRLEAFRAANRDAPMTATELRLAAEAAEERARTSGFELLRGKKFDHRVCLPVSAVENGAVIPDGWKLDIPRRAYFIDGDQSAKAEGGKE